MEIVHAPQATLTVIGKVWAEHPGCSIRRGAFFRARLIDQMERAGFTPMIAAEIHNMHLQPAFVQSGYGVRAAACSLYRQESFYRFLENIASPNSSDLHRSVAIVRVGQLGALGRAVELLEHGLLELFEAADTPKPATRHRRGVPANRRGRRDRPSSPLNADPSCQWAQSREPDGAPANETGRFPHGGASRVHRRRHYLCRRSFWNQWCAYGSLLKGSTSTNPALS